jgi:hypothetical protein
VSVRSLTAAEACFTAALLAGAALGASLDTALDEGSGSAGSVDFSFENWLIAALQQGWLVAVAPG